MILKINKLIKIIEIVNILFIIYFYQLPPYTYYTLLDKMITKMLCTELTFYQRSILVTQLYSYYNYKNALNEWGKWIHFNRLLVSNEMGPKVIWTSSWWMSNLFATRYDVSSPEFLHSICHLWVSQSVD